MNYTSFKQKYARRNQGDFISKTLNKAFMVHKKISVIKRFPAINNEH